MGGKNKRKGSSASSCRRERKFMEQWIKQQPLIDLTDSNNDDDPVIVATKKPEATKTTTTTEDEEEARTAPPPRVSISDSAKKPPEEEEWWATEVTQVWAQQQLPSKKNRLDEFRHIWTSVENDMSHNIEDLELSKAVRASNSRMQDSCNQMNAQYGRIEFEPTEKLLNALELTSTDTFLDIGHGIGNVVLQAAYTRRCQSRGIEVVEARNAIATAFRLGLLEQCLEINNVQLLRGQLQDPQHRVFLTQCPVRFKAFCNNYNGVFAERSAKARATYYLDHYVAGLFCLMPPGSILITLHPLPFLIPTQQQVQRERQKRGLSSTSSNASFYNLSESVLCPEKGNLSWASGCNDQDLIIYRYERLHQEESSRAVFQCWNPECKRARSGRAVDAFQSIHNDLIVPNSCSCNAPSIRHSTRRKTTT